MILAALAALGCQASLAGDEPATEAEFAERVTVHAGPAVGWADVQPALVAVAIQRRRGEVDAMLLLKLAQGGPFGGRLFDIDQRGMTRLNAALTIAETTEALGLAWPGMAWTAHDNSLFPVPTLTVLRQMVVTLGAHGRAIYAAWQAHKAALAQCTSLAEVDAHDIAAGWPA